MVDTLIAAFILTIAPCLIVLVVGWFVLSIAEAIDRGRKKDDTHE